MISIVRNISGQVSLFFATTVVVLITFIAFIVNIGLFVKAKINLQNAVDAAAWAGASVQARQLTNIGYMNWEMRNTYKEWMFKYYVLGNMSLDVIFNGAGSNSDFTMESIDESRRSEFGIDSYNFPSVCVNFAARSDESPNICRLYSIPGLPAFRAQNLVQVDQVTTALLNSVTAAKMEACTRRSALNFLTTNMWAYNVKEAGGISTLAPEIAPDRQGAFPQAFEIALRIRSLEKFVNTPPLIGGVCNDQGNAAGNCSRMLNDVETESYPGNERVVKAFTSGFRNLGNEANSEMKDSFTLTELSPQQVVFSEEQDLSNLLIPSSQRIKYYLDLKLMTLNFATFFTSFTSDSASKLETSAGTTDVIGRCDASKIALPVPGYPLGYVKNPSVLTYYAVRGQANWVGLFNPFDLTRSAGGIKLTAYAAAKPFGGRIGPMLFDVLSNPSKVMPRASTVKKVSSGYLMGVDLNPIIDWKGDSMDTTSTAFASGAPLPLSEDFWIQNASAAVGGFTEDDDLLFAIPNLVYDYPNDSVGSDKSYFSSEGSIDVARTEVGGNNSLRSGLYNGDILNKFRENLTGLGEGAGFGPTAIKEAIEKVRGPTQYDANHYLIPTPTSINEELNVDSFGPTNGSTDGTFNFRLFAPLFSEHSLYQSPVDAVGELNRFLNIQVKAVEKFRNAMNAAALQVATITNPNNGDPVGRDAARGFSDIDLSLDVSEANQGRPSCSSLTGKFIHFFLGSLGTSLMSSSANCVDEDGQAMPSLSEALRAYWGDRQQELSEIYISSYTIKDSMKTKVFSAYRPGPLHDSSPNGIWQRTIGSAISIRMWRNFYSTKFISLNSLKVTGHYNASSSGFPVTSEGNETFGELSDLNTNYNYLNSLDLDAIGVDSGHIFH